MNCPECGSKDVAAIIYLPLDEKIFDAAERGEVILRPGIPAMDDPGYVLRSNPLSIPVSLRWSIVSPAMALRIVVQR